MDRCLLPRNTMDTEVTRKDISFHVLRISAESEDLEDDVKREVRRLKHKTQLDGFRPGRVPAHLLKRIYKNELTEKISRGLVSEVFKDLVEDSDMYDVTGPPWTTRLEYELDGPLEAEVTFNVLPRIDYDVLKKYTLKLPTTQVTEAVVQDALQELAQDVMETRFIEGDESIKRGDRIFCDLQEVDIVTKVVLIGGLSEKEVLLDPEDPMEEEPYASVLEACIGHCLGDTVFVSTDSEWVSLELDLPASERLFRTTIQRAERDVLPELTTDVVREVTDGVLNTEEQLLKFVRRKTKESFQSMEKAFAIHEIRLRMLELFRFELPSNLLKSISAAAEMDEADVAEHLRWAMILEAADKDLMAQNDGVQPKPPDIKSPYPSREDFDEEAVNEAQALIQQERVAKYLQQFFTVREVALSDKINPDKAPSNRILRPW